MHRTAKVALVGLSVAGWAGFASAQGLSSSELSVAKEGLQGLVSAQPAAGLNIQTSASESMAASSLTVGATASRPSSDVQGMAMTAPMAPGSGGSISLSIPPEAAALSAGGNSGGQGAAASSLTPRLDALAQSSAVQPVLGLSGSPDTGSALGALTPSGATLGR